MTKIDSGISPFFSKALLSAFFILFFCQDMNAAGLEEKEKMEQLYAQTEPLARELLSQMSLKEKVFEMSGNGIFSSALSMMFRGHAGLVKMGGNKKRKIPRLSFADGPRGVGTAVATNFPVTMLRGSSWNRDLEKRIGEAMGTEARASGANYSGAVCVNVLRHPAWGRAQETYSEDPFLLGELGAALTTGIQSRNVMACIKHFALNNIENNRFVVDVQTEERTLREVYLPHFKKCLDAGAVTLMSAYNRFRGEYCAHQPYLLQKILREEWGFRGFVSSDWLWGLRNTEKGIKAGMNIEMPSAKFYTLKKVEKALASGAITLEDIDNLVFPIIHTKLAWEQRADEGNYSKKQLACKEHIALAREAAEEGIVLLKNENNLLPLDASKPLRILVTGSLAKTANDGDRASSKVKTKYVVTPWKGLRDFSSNAILNYCNGKKKNQLRKMAREADLVLVMAGYTYQEEGEFIHLKGHKGQPDKKPLLAKAGLMSRGDRLSLELPQRDLEIISAIGEEKANMVVTLFSGSAVVMESWKEQANAILMAFYPGMEGGHALASILFGTVNPSGKLPFTIPKKESDLPHFDPWTDRIDYGYYHGYTLFDKEKITPAFPFGHGLSYTSFSYSNLFLVKETLFSDEPVRISADVTNTGSRSGQEVVQVYVGFPQHGPDRPERLLRGFEKIFLLPGETKTVNFEISKEDLAFFDPSQNEWKTDSGSYTISIGSSSDTRFHHTLNFQIRQE